MYLHLFKQVMDNPKFRSLYKWLCNHLEYLNDAYSLIWFIAGIEVYLIFFWVTMKVNYILMNFAAII